jgi:hypothetical protein
MEFTMNTIKRFQHPTQHRATRRMLLALWLLLPPGAFGGGVVTHCTEANLRAAMAGGGMVTFACDGTISLTGAITSALSTSLDASGHQVTISGANSVRVFQVNTNVSLELANLTIVEGRSASGGGIYNEGGTVSLRGTILQGNVALTNGGCGGALFNRGGVINATDCAFIGNVAQSLTNNMAEHAGGGAIFNQDGAVNLQRCVFAGNRACAALESGYPLPPFGPGVPGSNGIGGAICNFGSLSICSCTFRDNLATGGMGGPGMPGDDYPFGDNDPPTWGGYGGNGYGGAIFNTHLLVVSNSLFVGNQASGGVGGRGGRGGFALYASNSGAWGGSGGDGIGAALFSSNGIVSLLNCTVASNTCTGGSGGTGGTGGETVKGYGGTGGSGGAGGGGLGVIYVRDDCAVTNCTFAFNLGVAGSGGMGGGGGWSGLYLTNSPPGSPGTPGSAIGGINVATGKMLNSLLATNTPGGNSFGTIADKGHNLSSDGTCNFTNVGSLNNLDPKLGPLADNGGPTLTMALLAGSPAIDAANSVAFPSNDQRGIPRPSGAAPDIGAYEYAPLLTIRHAAVSGIEIILRDAAPTQPCRLLTSTNLCDWVGIATNQVNVDGTLRFAPSLNPSELSRHYRTVVP